MSDGCCFPNARQCTAMSKRTRKRCKAPASKGRNVCRFHGGRAGAPRGARNGAYRHGLYTKEAIAERQAVQAVLASARRVLGTVGTGRFAGGD